MNLNVLHLRSHIPHSLTPHHTDFIHQYDLLNLLLVKLDDFFLFFFAASLFLLNHFLCSLSGGRVVSLLPQRPTALARVEQIKPVEQVWIFPQSPTILLVTDSSIIAGVDLVEDIDEFLATDSHITIDQTTPVANNL